MSTNVPVNRKIDNLENSEIWPVKFLMFSSSCPSSDFNDFGIKISVRSWFTQNKRNSENPTIGFCSIVYQTSAVFWDTRQRVTEYACEEYRATSKKAALKSDS